MLLTGGPPPDPEEFRYRCSTIYGDLRGYLMPAAILNFLEVRAVRLMSNNPEKIQALERAGVQVTERIPCLVDPIGSTANYLRTKREKLGHLLDTP